jgi:glyoxylase-like metal-dependent hydrolase (beta-lactamase superfamily II)
MSHHHPHYTAGLRPFVHAGVTLLTTPGNRALLESVATRPHRMRPDAQEREPRAAQFELVEGHRVLTDATATLELIDVGAASGHTDEYVVFYLPQHRLLFEGDLGWLPTAEADAFVGRRARRLLALIDGLDREVERVIQSWPLEGQRRVATIEELRAWAKVGSDG